MPGKKLQVEFVIPIYNEEEELEVNTLKLYRFLKRKRLPYLWNITIADNASTDKSGQMGKNLQKKYPNISYVYLAKKGRGRAVKYVWKKSKADICAYMDVDLSTDLSHLLPFINSLIDGYDIAIGSRLLPESCVFNRPFKREILSRGYNILIKLFFRTRFSDAQCGFKAVTRKVIDRILPSIEDNGWFFDSELLIIAEKSGFRIYEEAVTWHDNPGSTVRVLKTVRGDLLGLWRLFWTRPWRKMETSDH